MSILDYPRGSGPLCDRRKKKMLIIGGGVTLVFVILLAIIIPLSQSNSSGQEAPGSSALDYTPLIDGHNDLPHNIYRLDNNELEKFAFQDDMSKDPTWGTDSATHTDLPRLRKGKVGAQFWAAYVACNDTQYKDAVERTLEQIDVIKRLVKKYPNDLELVTSVQGIWDAFEAKRIGSLIGVEGGHAIDSRMSVLRLYYELGVRYMTLTHTCNTPWADSSTVDTDTTTSDKGPGLTEFGKEVVLEMNRLGMMVDLSHVSYNTMKTVLEVSKAPVIFSHSSVYKLCPNARNVRDDIIEEVKKKDGLIMVNFFSGFIQCTSGKDATIEDVVEHINHIRKNFGVDYVGLGGDYDGVDSVPTGLEDVSKYPALFDRLGKAVKEGDIVWNNEELQKLAGGNLLRVFKKVEQVSESMKSNNAYEKSIPAGELTAVNSDTINVGTCRSDIGHAAEVPSSTTESATGPTTDVTTVPTSESTTVATTETTVPTVATTKTT